MCLTEIPFYTQESITSEPTMALSCSTSWNSSNHPCSSGIQKMQQKNSLSPSLTFDPRLKPQFDPRSKCLRRIKGVKLIVLAIIPSVLIISSCGSNSAPTSFTETVEDVGYSFEMIPVQSEQGVFWISQTEVPWDIYDKFLEIVNNPTNLAAGVDAITGPTPAYASVDRGYGRNGYPALSMSAKAAEAYCAWLSSVAGYRRRWCRQWPPRHCRR